MNAPTRIRLRIAGRVQGVGFRWFVREQARRLGLSGWVRNEEDGTVLLEAEGPSDLIVALQSAVGRGPDASEVERVQSLPAGDGTLSRPFSVER